MMKFTLTIALLAVLSLPVFSQQGAPGTRIGFVNAETVLKELPAAQQANRNLEEWGGKIQDTLRMMQKEFESRIENFRKQEAMMSADAKRKEEEGLAMLRQRFAQYQEEKLGNQGELARLRETFLAPIREKVAAAVAAVAKEEKLQVVLDKVGGLVLFSDDKLDITYKVLDRIKRGDK
jgi:outer membrane protein